VSANGNVGPPLVNMAHQVYLAGVLPNTPENLIRWIRAPQAIDPLTAMPDLQVPEAQALDMAAYLYRLKER
jgi:cytochrome c1